MMRQDMEAVEGFGNWLNNLVISIRSVLHRADDGQQGPPAQQW